jgi:hypothetical protein
MRAVRGKVLSIVVQYTTDINDTTGTTGTNDTNDRIFTTYYCSKTNPTRNHGFYNNIYWAEMSHFSHYEHTNPTAHLHRDRLHKRP